MKLSRLAPVAIISAALFVSACANTVRGVTKDVKETGKAVEQAVE